jgi:hypothetical protein
LPFQHWEGGVKRELPDPEAKNLRGWGGDSVASGARYVSRSPVSRKRFFIIQRILRGPTALETRRGVTDTTEVVIGESSELDFAAIRYYFSRLVVGWAISC